MDGGIGAQRCDAAAGLWAGIRRRDERWSASASRPGIEIYGYSARQYGDWRASYRQWTPVVVYEVNGQYYPTNVRGARQVQVYRSQGGYFLPPRDQDWARTDKRFKNKRRPTDADYGGGGLTRTTDSGSLPR